MKFFLLILACFLSLKAMAFTKGFNQAWMKNDFGTQWLNGVYDARYVEELMLLNKNNNSTSLKDVVV